MKRLLMAVLTAFASMAAWADGEVGLYIINEQTNTFEVAQLQKISFQDNNVVVLKTDGSSETFAISGISKMYFGELTTGINEMALESADVWDGKSLKVNGNTPVEVFNSSGIAVAKGKYEKGDVISLENLPKGIYVVKMGNKSLKIAK